MGHGNGCPSPYTYDPHVHDQGRLRPQPDGRRRRLQHQVLRRAVRRDARARARTRSSCSATCATRPATASRQRRPDACRPPGSASTTTPPASSAGAARRHRRRPQAARRTTSGRCSRPTSRSSLWRNAPELQRPRRSLRVDAATPGATATWTPTAPTGELLPLARPAAERSPRATSPAPCADAGADPDHIRRARQRLGRAIGAELLARRDRVGRPARSRRDRASSSSLGPRWVAPDGVARRPR